MTRSHVSGLNGRSYAVEDDSLFRKPVGDWTDAEIRVGLAELAKVMAAEEPGAVLDGLHALSVVLADASHSPFPARLGVQHARDHRSPSACRWNRA